MTTTVIQPRRRLDAQWFTELWQYRELLLFLVWRDLKVRYKQTAFGASWAILQPVLLMAVYSVFLGHLARVPSDGVGYPVFVLSALVPWTLFSASTLGASNSVIDSSALVSKVYTPRIVLPVAAAASFLIDFCFSLVVLLVLVATIGPGLGVQALLVLPLALLAWASALACGVFLSAVNVRYRDVKYAVPFLVQLGLFMSPVVYPTSLVPERFQLVYSLNPMVGVIDGFRWALLDVGSPPGTSVLVSATAAAVLLTLAAAYFVRAERTFADVI